MVFASVWGVLLAGIFLWRRNLVAGTVAHALYNFMVLLT
ncbi:MAG: type II CAAX prenyl endopeptidase Rce1 family protein [Gemmatimonadota bacterium]